MTEGPLISVIDDDVSVRDSLPSLLRPSGYSARAFASAQQFLAGGCVGNTRGPILEGGMPGMSGPELQPELKRWAGGIPILFTTGPCDATLGTRRLAKGAVRFLLKPLSESDLLGAVDTAVASK